MQKKPVIVSLNPSVDRIIHTKRFDLDGITHAHSSQIVAGGKGINVARVLKSFGYPFSLLNLVAGLEGELLKMLLEKEGIRSYFIEGRGMTREVIRIAEDASRTLLTFNEPGPACSEETLQRLLCLASHLMENEGSYLVMSGSVPESSLERAYAELIARSKPLNVVSVLDSRGEAFRLGVQASPAVVKCNREEFEEFTGESFSPSRLGELTAQSRIVIVTAGSEGAWAVWDGELLFAEPPQIDALNPVGSGDSFLAGLLIAMMNRWSKEEALAFATACGVVNALYWEPARVSPPEVQDFVKRVRVRRGG